MQRSAGAADFASGVVQSLDIPVDTWAKLWTREANVGTASVEEDPAGLRIPVKPGEELALSSIASLEGSGSLSRELVSRATQFSASVHPGPGTRHGLSLLRLSK